MCWLAALRSSCQRPDCARPTIRIMLSWQRTAPSPKWANAASPPVRHCPCAPAELPPPSRRSSYPTISNRGQPSLHPASAERRPARQRHPRGGAVNGGVLRPVADLRWRGQSRVAAAGPMHRWPRWQGPIAAISYCMMPAAPGGLPIPSPVRHTWARGPWSASAGGGSPTARECRGGWPSAPAGSTRVWPCNAPPKRPRVAVARGDRGPCTPCRQSYHRIHGTEPPEGVDGMTSLRTPAPAVAP